MHCNILPDTPCTIRLKSYKNGIICVETSKVVIMFPAPSHLEYVLKLGEGPEALSLTFHLMSLAPLLLNYLVMLPETHMPSQVNAWLEAVLEGHRHQA